MTTIEGEKINKEPETLPVVASESSHQVVSFNPLAAEPVQFKRELETRKENYDNLAVHLRGMLIPGKDFGKIHIEKNCPDKYHCTDPYHFTPYTLFAPGADKILGVLSLGVSYPNEQDFVRAALKGNQIFDVIMSCHILGGRGDSVVSEGMGACSRDEEKGNLNRTIKKSCKRARVDAVMRLPAISALFEDDFLAQVEAEAGRNGGNSTTARTQQVNKKWDTGAKLREWPKGGKLAGQKFVDMEDSALDWICSKCQNDPDIFKAAKLEVDRRVAMVTNSTSNEPPKSNKPPPAGAVTNDYEDYPEAQ